MPTDIQANQILTQFLKYIVSFRLKEAGELVSEDTWYDLPGADWLEGYTGLEALAAYLHTMFPDGRMQEEPLLCPLGQEAVEIRAAIVRPDQCRLCWSAVVVK